MQALVTSLDGQFDPLDMTDRMIEIIPQKEKHGARTMLPASLALFCKDDQKAMWPEDISNLFEKPGAPSPGT